MKQYCPLYPGIDNTNHSPEPYPSSSSCDKYPIPPKCFTKTIPYQEIVTHLHKFTYEYNKLHYLHHQHKPTTNHNSISIDSISSSSNTTSSLIPLTPIPILKFHDCILPTKKKSNKSTTSPTILPTTSPFPHPFHNIITHNTPIPTTTINTLQSPITNVTPTYHSDSSQAVRSCAPK